MLNEYGELNVSYLYETFLNGGCPRTDWDDVKEWAEKLLKRKDSDYGTTGTGCSRNSAISERD